jgi:hypothetical protein
MYMCVCLCVCVCVCVCVFVCVYKNDARGCSLCFLCIICIYMLPGAVFWEADDVVVFLEFPTVFAGFAHSQHCCD